MKHFLLPLFLLSCLACLAQDPSVKTLKSESDKKLKKDPNDTTQRIWKAGGIYGLNLSQGTLNNWAAGGDEFSLSINSILSLFAFYKKDAYSWDNTFDFNVGYIKTSSLGGRKNDDRFDLLSKFGYAIAPKTNLALLFNLRSQFFRGYNFKNNSKSLTSNFMAPGYVLLSLGIDMKPTPSLSIFLSPATARWVIVRDTSLANRGLYGVTPGEKSYLEFGAFATINFMKEFNKNVTYKGRLDLFSNYRRNPEKIDVFISNVLNLKFSRVLSATWAVDLIYDNDVKLFGDNQDEDALQLKSLVGIGLLVTIR